MVSNYDWRKPYFKQPEKLIGQVPYRPLLFWLTDWHACWLSDRSYDVNDIHFLPWLVGHP